MGACSFYWHAACLLGVKNPSVAIIFRTECPVKLSLEVHQVLASINLALMNGDESALAAAFDGVDLQQLFNQKTIAVTRALGKKPMTLLLCTLAEQNNVEAVRAKHWLDCYQSVLQKKLAPAFSKLSANHVLRIALEALMAETSIEPASLVGQKIKGSTQSWQDAVELLLDHKAWRSTLSLVQHLGHSPQENEIWHQLSRSLSKRFHLYVDISGQAQVDVDYLMLAQIVSLCAAAADRANAPAIHRALTQLAASAFETAGEYDCAISALTGIDPHKQSAAIQIDLARCLCKKSDQLASIEKLDRAIALLASSQNNAEQIEHSALLGARPVMDTPDQGFDLQHASQALSDLSQMAQAKGTPVFLVSGTLLGYVREGQLLAHDKDIDVGIVGWENQYTLCMALQQSGLFKVSAHYLKGADTFYIPIQHNATGMWIDVFVYHPKGESWVTGVDFFFGHQQSFAFTPFEMKTIEFLGVSMQVPENAELNLTENYGNWRIPDASYLSHLESPSTMNKGNLDYMITARMSLIAACLQGQTLKIEKVLTLMNLYPQMPGAMSPNLMTTVQNAYLKQVETQKETCHA